MSIQWMLIILLTIITNVVCGIFRAKSETLLKRLLFIHLPIPFIAWMRISYNISWKYIPILIVVAVAGQLGGGFLEKKV